MVEEVQTCLEQQIANRVGEAEVLAVGHRRKRSWCCILGVDQVVAGPDFDASVVVQEVVHNFLVGAMEEGQAGGHSSLVGAMEGGQAEGRSQHVGGREVGQVEGQSHPAGEREVGQAAGQTDLESDYDLGEVQAVGHSRLVDGREEAPEEELVNGVSGMDYYFGRSAGDLEEERNRQTSRRLYNVTQIRQLTWVSWYSERDTALSSSR